MSSSQTSQSDNIAPSLSSQSSLSQIPVSNATEGGDFSLDLAQLDTARRRQKWLENGLFDDDEIDDDDALYTTNDMTDDDDEEGELFGDEPEPEESASEEQQVIDDPNALLSHSYEEEEYNAFLQLLDDAIEEKKISETANSEEGYYYTLRNEIVNAIEHMKYENGGTVSVFKHKNSREFDKEVRKLDTIVKYTKQDFEISYQALLLANTRVDLAKQRLEKAYTIRLHAYIELDHYRTSDDVKFKAVNDLAVLERNLADAAWHEHAAGEEYAREVDAMRLCEKQLRELKMTVEENKEKHEVYLAKYRKIDRDRQILELGMLSSAVYSLQKKKIDRDVQRQQELLEIRMHFANKVSYIVENAKQERKVAAHRLKETLADRAAQKRPLLEAQAKEEERRKKAMKDLARSTYRAKREIMSVVHKKQKRLRHEAEKHKEQMTAITLAGGNPWEVMRAQREQEKVNRLKREKTLYIQERYKVIAERLEHEEKRANELETQRKERTREIKEFNEKRSAKAQRDALTNYIATKTKDHVEIVDPLGISTKLYPSKVMEIGMRDVRFGCGIGAVEDQPHLLDMMKSQYPDVKANEHALPKRPKEKQRPKASDKKVKLDHDSMSDEELAENEIEYTSGLWKEKAYDLLNYL